MLCVLSPAKRLDFHSPLPSVQATKPEFETQASAIARRMRGYDSDSLRALMGVSASIARENYERFRCFESNAARPAIYAFIGDTYRGLGATLWDASLIERAQRRLRILSGLYGVLRPLDAIRPYRLEMGLRLQRKWQKADSPAEWWRVRVTRSLSRTLDAEQSPCLVNLASKEYSAALDRARLCTAVVDVVFAEKRGGKLRSLGMAVKYARGAMARFIVARDVRTLAGLRDFSEDGFAFVGSVSSSAALHFHR